MKVLLQVIKTPDCRDNYKMVMQTVDSSTLDTQQIEKAVAVNPLSNEIEISTDDFATYVDREAIFELKIQSSKSQQESGTLLVTIRFVQGQIP